MSHVPPPLEVVNASDAYDRYAPRYNDLLQENRINAYMRREMTRILLSTFPPGSRLLELGCGTGDEALELASHGCEIIASDPSTKMIEIAQRKAERHPSGNRVEFRVGRASESNDVLDDQSQASFNGAYSSFALSYEADLRPSRNALTRLIRTGGVLVVSAMNRLCGSEWLLSMISGRPWFAGRRLRPSTLHKVGSVRTPVFCRTTAELVRAFEPGFVLEDLRALPAILLPHYANRPLMRWPALVDILEGVDPWVARLPAVRTLGDQTVAKMRRVG